MRIVPLIECGSWVIGKDSYLRTLFELVLHKEPVVMIHTKEEFRALEHREWVVGFAVPFNNIIMVIDHASSGRTHEEWLKVIVHELVHLYYFQKFGNNNPRWFFEGLACYIADQEKKETQVTLKELIQNFKSSGEFIYPFGFNVVKKMLK